MAAVLSVIVMGTYAEAAEITVSESRIELDKAQTEFSFELDIEEDELFALIGDPYTYYMTAEEYQAISDTLVSLYPDYAALYQVPAGIFF